VIREKTTLKDVRLRGARITGQISVTKSHILGVLDMSSMRITQDAFLGCSHYKKPVYLRFSQIGGTLDLTASNLAGVDLTGATIAGVLLLGSEDREDSSVMWAPEGRFTLINATVQAIGDHPKAWPPKGRLDLQGFTYSRLGAGPKDPAARNVTWFTDWLQRDGNTSPQPYKQLADVLRGSGYLEKANDVLYAGKERERAAARGIHRVVLEGLKYTIGYGLGAERYARTLIWVGGFVLLGVAILRVTGEGQRNAMPYGVVYSFDMLIPVIKLRDAHYHIELFGPARYYFYLHKLAGYLLASFLVAGFSGLTK